MENYNLTILINNKVDEKGRTGLMDDVKKEFGNLVKEELWGVRTLAYEIKHMDKAFFANFEFEAEPKAIITLDKNIRLNEDIVRYLLVRSKKVKRMKPGQVKRSAVKAEVPAEASKEVAGSGKEAKDAALVSEEKEVKSTKRLVKINTKKKA
jgi:small subunit ribosomal protein S6